MKHFATPGVEVRPVVTRADRRRFVELPWAIYDDDPAWVPPLKLERHQALSQSQPFFDHARGQAFLAWRGERPVGRITAQVDLLHAVRHGGATGYFGFLEAVDDPAVFASLFAVAEQWLLDQGQDKVVGPFSWGVNQECGLLVDGFDTPPFFMMGHARPYFERHVTACGYCPAQDTVAYLLDPSYDTPPVVARLLSGMSGELTVRPIRRANAKADLELMRDVFNDAWAENWGFVPFTAEEFRAVGQEMLLILPDEFIQIAEVQGRAVAFIVLLPNVNEVIADLEGKVLPLNWVKLLHRLKVKFPTSGRVPLMGVRREFHNTRRGPGLAYAVIQAVREHALAKGLTRVELSWVLADNHGMRSIIESIGGVVSKRYRFFDKALAVTQAPN